MLIHRGIGYVLHSDAPILILDDMAANVCKLGAN